VTKAFSNLSSAELVKASETVLRLVLLLWNKTQ